MQHPKSLLARYGLAPKKSLGQNFLFDESVLQRIVDAAGLEPGDGVLEIGPGLGALTAVLLKSADAVVAVELDDRLLPILRDQLGTPPHLTLIHGDILDQDPATLFDRPWRVIANVPYYITGAILRHLLEAPHKPRTMVLTVQQEVATRLAAKPGDLSLAALGVQFYGDVHTVGKLAAGAFWPRPKVDSAIVRIDLHRTPPLADPDLFFRVARAGFSQKRKQLYNTLRSLCQESGQVASWLESAEIDGRRRAETLSLAEWITLTRHFSRLQAA
jgi:16S rRNA (adenine1518-N6/adenine1519-N6)-dimethyltransferase